VATQAASFVCTPNIFRVLREHKQTRVRATATFSIFAFRFCSFFPIRFSKERECGIDLVAATLEGWSSSTRRSASGFQGGLKAALRLDRLGSRLASAAAPISAARRSDRRLALQFRMPILPSAEKLP
jgi:hypothetical protein